MAAELRQLRVDLRIKPIGPQHRGLEIIEIEQERDAAKMAQGVLQTAKKALGVLTQDRFAICVTKP